MAWAASPVFHVLSLFIAVAALVLVLRGRPARRLSLVVLCGGAVLSVVWVGLLVTTGNRSSLVALSIVLLGTWALLGLAETTSMLCL